MLMGCALSFAIAVKESGLAADIASLVHKMDAGNYGSLFLVYILTGIMTSLISNNAAATLMYPFCIAVAEGLNVSFVPFCYVTMIAASATFLSPMGYQTHLMVWGRGKIGQLRDCFYIDFVLVSYLNFYFVADLGGYTMKDFAKFGAVPNLIFCLCTCWLTPYFFPF